MTGEVFLDSRDGCRFAAKGEVHFQGAELRGGLHCSGASFSSSGESAVSCNSARITGDVRFDSADEFDFEAEGRVQLVGAEISGNLSCQGASFTHSEGDALDLSDAVIAGRVLLGGGEIRKSDGTFRFCRGAKVAGSVVCQGATMGSLEAVGISIEKTEREETGQLNAALDARWLTVRGRVHFGDPPASAETPSGARRHARLEKGQSSASSIRGGMRLDGVSIASDLVLSGVQLLGSENPSISGVNMQVGGDVRLDADFLAESSVALVQSAVGKSLHIRNASLQGDGVAFVGDATSVSDRFYWREITLSESGSVSLRNMTVGELWDEKQSWSNRLPLVSDSLFAFWWNQRVRAKEVARSVKSGNERRSRFDFTGFVYERFGEIRIRGSS